MNHLDDLLSAYLDGELSGAERADADRHLEVCEVCRFELAVVESARVAMRSLPAIELPSKLMTRASRRRKWIPAPAWITAGVVAAALSFGLVMGPGEPSESFEMETLNEQHIARVVGDPGVATFRGDAP
ncbi:MAG: anti-sigma factor [Actinomycetota bacterium]